VDMSRIRRRLRAYGGSTSRALKDGSSPVRRFDHVGIIVADLDTVTAFFVGLGLEVEGAR
jgi:hypothetical protein